MSAPRLPSPSSPTHVLLLMILLALLFRPLHPSLAALPTSKLSSHLTSSPASPPPFPATLPPLPLSNLYADEADDVSIEAYFAQRQKAQSKETETTFQFETFWTDADTDMKVCRVHNVCMREDGTIAVNERLRKNETQLLACGFEKLSYLDENEYKPSDVDLLGVMPVRDHMPHFLTDFAPGVRAVELVKPTFINRSEIQRTCERPGAECIQVGLNLVMYGEERLRGQSIRGWVGIVKEMLLPGVGLYILEHGPRCFRSVIAYQKHSFVGLDGSKWLGKKNPSFRRNGINRGRASKKCNVKILNRMGWAGRRGRMTGRDVLNIGELETQLTREVSQHVQVVYFEDLTVGQQAKLMQDTTILIATHGAALSNLLFARPGTQLLEISPFGYAAGPFDIVAQVMNIHHHQFTAHPDTQTVTTCLHQKGSFHDPELAQAEQLWTTGVQQYPQNVSAIQFHLHPRFEVRSCARSQRMLVDVRKVIRWTKRAIRNAC